MCNEWSLKSVFVNLWGSKLWCLESKNFIQSNDNTKDKLWFDHGRTKISDTAAGGTQSADIW
jgi:hypothetical protein